MYVSQGFMNKGITKSLPTLKHFKRECDMKKTYDLFFLFSFFPIARKKY